MSDSDVTDNMYESEDEMSASAGEERAPEEEVLATESSGEKDTATTTKKKRSKRTPGVIYLSRIPPYMKPHKLKHLLSPYGTVGHIFLQPEGE